MVLAKGDEVRHSLEQPSRRITGQRLRDPTVPATTEPVMLRRHHCGFLCSTLHFHHNLNSKYTPYRMPTLYATFHSSRCNLTTALVVRSLPK